MHRHHGFSFAEVMFAIAILGVGFIMVASIFPVAAEQARSTNDQAIAAQLGRDAVNTIQASTKTEDFTDLSGHVIPFSTTPALWNAVAGSVICKSDRRYAWVPFYSRSSSHAAPAVTVLVIRRWIHDSYTAADEDSGTGGLIARGISIGITRAGGSNTVEVARDSQGYFRAVAPGCYLIVTSADSDTAGHVLQIGELKSETADSVFWTLAPSSNLDDESCSNGSSAAVIGRDLMDAANPDSGYSGPAQDISVFKTFLNVN